MLDFVTAVASIVLIDLVLSGDNALVIGADERAYGLFRLFRVWLFSLHEKGCRLSLLRCQAIPEFAEKHAREKKAVSLRRFYALHLPLNIYDIAIETFSMIGSHLYGTYGTRERVFLDGCIDREISSSNTGKGNV